MHVDVEKVGGAISWNYIFPLMSSVRRLWKWMGSEIKIPKFLVNRCIGHRLTAAQFNLNTRRVQFTSYSWKCFKFKGLEYHKSDNFAINGPVIKCVPSPIMTIWLIDNHLIDPSILGHFLYSSLGQLLMKVQPDRKCSWKSAKKWMKCERHLLPNFRFLRFAGDPLI